MTVSIVSYHIHGTIIIIIRVLQYSYYIVKKVSLASLKNVYNNKCEKVFKTNHPGSPGPKEPGQGQFH